MIDSLIPSIPSVLSITLMAALFGLALSLVKIKLKVDKDPRIDEVLKALPGANCGACGLPGCAAYATRIVEEKYQINLCPVGGADSANKIAEVMGVNYDGSTVKLRARVHCQGGLAETVRRFNYHGPRDCSAANGIMGGFKVCEYGCLGFGDCVRACNFDAIYLNENGLPVVDRASCVGCAMCAHACPRNIISMEADSFGVHVLCRSEDTTPVMRKGCTVGCIACRLCEKACKQVMAREHNVPLEQAVPAITVVKNHARIDYNLCIDCYACAEVCPVPVIHPITRSKKVREVEAARLKPRETQNGAESGQ